MLVAVEGEEEMVMGKTWEWGAGGGGDGRCRGGRGRVMGEMAVGWRW